MKIGIRLHDTAGATLEEHLAAAREQGFTCIHLALQKVIPGFTMAEAPERLTPEFAKEIRGLLEKYGMECAVLGCYLNLATPDEEKYRQTVEIYKAHLRFGRWIGALTVGTETGAPNPGYKTEPACWTEESLQLIIRRMRPVADYAAEVGQCFAIEPVWRHIVSTPERARRVLEALPNPPSIIFDPVNLLSGENCGREQEVFADGLSRLGGSIRVIHMKDWLHEAGEPDVKATASGTGSCVPDQVLRFALSHPDIPITLENTRPDNAVAARSFLEARAAAL